MEANFIVTSRTRNLHYTPWNGQVEFVIQEHFALTWKEACEVAKTWKRIWEKTAKGLHWEMGSWNSGNATHWAAVELGAIQYEIEICPTPEDSYDDLPW